MANLVGEIGFVAKRWKAIAALVGTLATALLAVAPHNTMLQLIVTVLGALATAGVVHQVPYKAAPTTVVGAVADTVTSTVTDTVDGVVGGVANTVDGVVGGVVGGVTGAVGGLLDGLTGKEGG